MLSLTHLALFFTFNTLIEAVTTGIVSSTTLQTQKNDFGNALTLVYVSIAIGAIFVGCIVGFFISYAVRHSKKRKRLTKNIVYSQQASRKAIDSQQRFMAMSSQIRTSVKTAPPGVPEDVSETFSFSRTYSVTTGAGK
jgi:predicted histidine transporter YuiF (NhaC family)